MAEEVENEHLWKGIHISERPGGWHRWSSHQVERWKEAVHRREIKRRMWTQEITRRAGLEPKISPHEIHVKDVDCDPINIRATYGPLTGTPASSIVVWEGDLRLEGVRQSHFGLIPGGLSRLPAVFVDFGDHWTRGPRYFLHHLFQIIGYFGGNAKVQMRPSNIKFDVEPVQFREMISQSEEMITLLAGNLKLLEDRG